MIFIIDRFVEENPPGKSPRTKYFFVSHSPPPHLDQIPKIKIFHMVTKEHPAVIEGRRWFIALDVIESEDSSDDASIYHDSAALYEDYGGGLVGTDVTEEVEYMKKVVRYSSLLSYMLKPYNLHTQVFENNRTAQEKLFRHM